VPVPAVEQAPALMLLPAVLSLIAGSCDIIGFIGLGGLFTAHITGNVVLLFAHVVAGADAPMCYMLLVPVFIAALGLTRLLAGGLEWLGIGSLRPLLLLQLLLLAGSLLLCVASRAPIDPNAGTALFGGMLGVSAMAVQNELVQLSLKGAPSTAVMTTNTTRVVMDLGDALMGRDRVQAAKAAARARRTVPSIAAFVVGCGLGAWCEVAAGLWSLALPAGLAFIALAIALATKLEERCWSCRTPWTGMGVRPKMARSHKGERPWRLRRGPPVRHCCSACGCGPPCAWPCASRLARARQCLLGRHVRRTGMTAASRRVAAQGMVPHDRHLSRGGGDRAADGSLDIVLPPRAW
jgi:uncharacterized membrane protein YoaK (UPF0700 family)